MSSSSSTPVHLERLRRSVGTAALSAAVVLAALVVPTAGPARGITSSDQPGAPCATRPDRQMSVVAHHDDDLLFLSPDLITSLRSGACLRAIYLVASDYHGEKTRESYLLAREKGLRAAYARAVGRSVDEWHEGTVTINGHDLPLFTLGDQLSVVEFRLPDNAASYTGPHGVVRPGGLGRLYDDDERLQDYYGRNSYDRKELIATLSAAIDDVDPGVVRTTDPSADEHGGTDYIDYHVDHVRTARLVGDAVARLQRRPQLDYYVDYANRYAARNLPTQVVSDKLDLFRTFAYYDTDICGPNVATESCTTSGQYFVWSNNEFRTTAASRLPWVAAVPGHPGHEVPTVFRGVAVRHVGSGRCLAVPGALDDLTLADGEHAALGRCGKRAPHFTLVRGLLKLDVANVCLAPPRGRVSVGTPVATEPCTGRRGERWSWSEKTGTLRHRHSDLVLGTRTRAHRRGTPMVLMSPDGRRDQRFAPR